MPAGRSAATPATTSAAAALSTTMSRCAPCSPPRTRRTTSALYGGSPPISCSCVAGARPSSTGSTGNVCAPPSWSQGEHRRRPGRRQLVEPAAVHDPGVGGAVGAQRRQHPLGEGGVGDADEVAAHPAGIGHRPEQVEHRRDPDLAAGRGGEAERGMEPGGEAEPDARRLDAALHAGRRQLDGDAQLLQDVGGPALRRRAACPVLADRDAGAGDDEGRHRRHVDRVRPVATGADHVDRPPAQLVVEGHQLGSGEHRVEQTGQLVGGLPLRPQGDDEPDQLRRGRPPAEDVRPSPCAPARRSGRVRRAAR